jgi:hypothetical protein
MSLGVLFCLIRKSDLTSSIGDYSIPAVCVLMHMLLQARIEREKHFEASLKSPDGIVVPREFLQHTQHAAPASARTNKFHIRGYKGTAFYHFSTKSRVLLFLNIHIHIYQYFDCVVCKLFRIEQGT